MIFPKEILEQTTLVHHSRIRVQSRVIYLAILVLLILVFATLPFLKVNVYTSAPGIIKPKKERLTISVMQSGQILRSNI